MIHTTTNVLILLSAPGVAVYEKEVVLEHQCSNFASNIQYSTEWVYFERKQLCYFAFSLNRGELFKEIICSSLYSKFPASFPKFRFASLDYVKMGSVQIPF